MTPQDPHSEPYPKRMKLSSEVGSESEADPPIKVYIVQPKLSPEEISDLINAIEHTGETKSPFLELCHNPDESDVIFTAIHMKKRLERHVSWHTAKQKAIVIPRWIDDSVSHQRPLPCGNYAAIGELHDETVHNCPDSESCVEYDQREDHELAQSPPFTPITSPINVPTIIPADLFYKARYACQQLAKEIDILKRARELEGKDMNARAYERAIASIKAYPHVIDSVKLRDEVADLSGIGKKALTKIEEFITTGQISEAREIQASIRFQCLSDMTSVYGIGPVTARRLYDRGLRTLDHLEAYYDVDDRETKQETRSDGRTRFSSKSAPEVTIKVGLAMRHDLGLPIPRSEVEEIYDVVMKELASIQIGCVSTIVGGYRRGKQNSNDVDIVISHSDWQGGGDKIKGLCTQLVQVLYSKGLVTHVMHLSSFRPHNALRTGHWDSLEKALTVFRLPSTDIRKRVHRRLDLIFACPESYWTAVVGWTGSKTFERDLRLWAKEQKGLRFDSSGITRRHDSKIFSASSEEDVFTLLGLIWVDPTLRNADV